MVATVGVLLLAGCGGEGQTYEEYTFDGPSMEPTLPAGTVMVWPGDYPHMAG